MLRKINSFDRGGLGTIFKGGKKIRQIRIFASGCSQVLRKINSFDRGGLGTIIKGGKKFGKSVFLLLAAHRCSGKLIRLIGGV